MSPLLEVSDVEEDYACYLEGLRRRLASMSPQAKMEECGKAIIYLPPYDKVKRASQSTHAVFVYDLINFSRRIFEDPLPMTAILETFEVEPGYGSLTGDVELGPAVRQLERSRAKSSAEYYGVSVPPGAALEDTAIFTCSGVTGGMFLALSGIMDMERAQGGQRRRVVYNSPTFSLADAFCKLYELEECPVQGQAERHFLPTLREVREACTDETLACVLVYPSNPFQVSWGQEDLAELRALIDHCQRERILLIADTIFQDVRWSSEWVPELFALARDSRYLCKVFSPSKDRPFACGYRIGYVITDPALARHIEPFTSLVYNALPTPAQAWLGVDLILRHARLKGSLDAEDWAALEASYVFGYGGLEPKASDLHRRVLATGLAANYARRLDDFFAKLNTGLSELWNWIAGSECFEVLPRPPYGNILMVRVRPEFVRDENMMFIDMLSATSTTAMVGGCFGLAATDGAWFRVLYGGNTVEATIQALDSLQQHLLAGARRCA